MVASNVPPPSLNRVKVFYVIVIIANLTADVAHIFIIATVTFAVVFIVLLATITVSVVVSLIDHCHFC